MTFYRPNDYLRVHFRTDCIHVELPLEQATFGTRDVDLVSFLLQVGKPGCRYSRLELIDQASQIANDRSIESSAAFVDELIRRQILVEEEFVSPLLAEAREWYANGWTEALPYQLASENQKFLEILGDVDDPPSRLLEHQERSRSDAFAQPLWKLYEQPYTSLPTPELFPDESLEKVLLRRRTHVPWSTNVLTERKLSAVFEYANQELRRLRVLVEEELSDDASVLTRNTFGDFEAYVAIFDVPDMEPGLYHYDAKGHALACIRKGVLRDEVTDAFLGQARTGSGKAAIILSVVWARQLWRYPNNASGYRTVMILAGQLAQRYLTAMTAFGFSTFPTPAHNPEEVCRVLGTDRYQESTVYLLGCG